MHRQVQIQKLRQTQKLQQKIMQIPKQDLMEDDGLYRTVTLDDYPVYYSVGKVTLPLSEDVTFEDQADQNQESDLPVVELNDLPAAIENSDMAFNCNNTVITVRQGQIVQIIRYWVP